MERLHTEPLAAEEPMFHGAEPDISATRVLESVAPVTRVLETAFLESDAWRLPVSTPTTSQQPPPRPQSPASIFSVRPGAQRAPGAGPVDTEAAAPANGGMPVSGDVLRDRYRIRRLLGQGGTGTVFEVHDAWRLQPPDGDPRVALKVLRAELARSGPRFTAFQREFQHLQSLSHPNIVRVHDLDRDGDLTFFTMEYLSGAQLGELLAQRRGQALPLPWALSVLRDVAAAVAHAHSRGVVHGDLNPANILVTASGEVRVLDFGASNQRQQGPWISAPDDPPRVATRPWASCEVLERGVPVPQDDVFSLACLAYQLLSGRHPFAERTALQARGAKLRVRRPSGVNSSTWWALRVGLRFERARRPRDAGEWLTLLDFTGAAARLPPLAQLVMRERTPRRWWRWALGAAAAATLLALSWWAGVHTDFSAPALRAAAMAPGAPHRP